MINDTWDFSTKGSGKHQNKNTDPPTRGEQRLRIRNSVSSFSGSHVPQNPSSTLEDCTSIRISWLWCNLHAFPASPRHAGAVPAQPVVTPGNVRPRGHGKYTLQRRWLTGTSIYLTIKGEGRQAPPPPLPCTGVCPYVSVLLGGLRWWAGGCAGGWRRSPLCRSCSPGWPHSRESTSGEVWRGTCVVSKAHTSTDLKKWTATGAASFAQRSGPPRRRCCTWRGFPQSVYRCGSRSCLRARRRGSNVEANDKNGGNMAELKAWRRSSRSVSWERVWRLRRGEEEGLPWFSEPFSGKKLVWKSPVPLVVSCSMWPNLPLPTFNLKLLRLTKLSRRAWQLW